jgi:putative transposase
MYHFVFPAKYRKAVFSSEVDQTLKDVCMQISLRYNIVFLEIGTDSNHVHFLIQSVPMYSATKIVTLIKSLTAKHIFKLNPEVKKLLWGGEFWSDGYFVNTVSRHGGEQTIANYVKNQGKEHSQYTQLHHQEIAQDLFL